MRVTFDNCPWPLRPLGDVVEVLDRMRRPVNSEERAQRCGAYPYYGANGQVGTIDEFIFDEELVLVAEDGGFFFDPLRPIAYRVSGKCWVNNHAHVLRPGPAIDVDWLCCAVAYKLNQKELREMLVPVPPVEEQLRMAARVRDSLERVDEIRRLREESLKEATALYPSVLHARFAALASKHTMRPLSKIASVRGGQSLPHGVDMDPGNRAVLLVKVGDMNLPGNEIVIGTSREFLPDADDGKAAPAGAVVLPKRGGAIATNKKRLLGRPALLDPNLMAVVPHGSDLRSEYLLAWFDNLDLSKLSNGGVIPQLNKKDLDPLELPLPNLLEQDRIVSSFREVREVAMAVLKAARENALCEAGLVHGILSKAFAGEL